MLVPYQGRMVEAVEVEVIHSDEKWNEYQLADGRVLEVKLVLAKACFATKEKGEDGQPIPLVNFQVVVKAKGTV